jgi:hypothetical protein
MALQRGLLGEGGAEVEDVQGEERDDEEELEADNRVLGLVTALGLPVALVGAGPDGPGGRAIRDGTGTADTVDTIGAVEGRCGRGAMDGRLAAGLSTGKLDPVDLDHNAEDGDVEREESDAVRRHDEGG